MGNINILDTSEAMEMKRNLYFEAKAEEVWLCAQQGKMSFYNKHSKLDNSLLVPDFPKQIIRRNQPAN
ncbi:MAG: hypothetical protein U7123_18590 [Potamolinea sp.]